MDEKRLKGLCFNCDEVFTQGHQCKKLFCIDSIDEEEESLEQETNPNTDQPEISLQAFIGVTAPQNMLLQSIFEFNEMIRKKLVNFLSTSNSRDRRFCPNEPTP